MQIMKDRKISGNQAFKIAFKYFFSPNCARDEKRKRGGGLHKSKLRNYCSLMTLNKLFRLTCELEFCSSSLRLKKNPNNLLILVRYYSILMTIKSS